MHYSPNMLSTITNCVDNCKVAVVEHESHEKGITIREVEPMAMVHKDGRKCLVGWCRLRNEYRSFRLDRVNSIKLKQEDFIPRPDFNVYEFQDVPGSTRTEEY